MPPLVKSWKPLRFLILTIIHPRDGVTIRNINGYVNTMIMGKELPQIQVIEKIKATTIKLFLDGSLDPFPK